MSGHCKLVFYRANSLVKLLRRQALKNRYKLLKLLISSLTQLNASGRDMNPCQRHPKSKTVCYTKLPRQANGQARATVQHISEQQCYNLHACNPHKLSPIHGCTPSRAHMFAAAAVCAQQNQGNRCFGQSMQVLTQVLLNTQDIRLTEKRGKIDP